MSAEPSGTIRCLQLTRDSRFVIDEQCGSVLGYLSALHVSYEMHARETPIGHGARGGSDVRDWQRGMQEEEAATAAAAAPAERRYVRVLQTDKAGRGPRLHARLWRVRVRVRV